MEASIWLVGFVVGVPCGAAALALTRRPGSPRVLGGWAAAIALAASLTMVGVTNLDFSSFAMSLFSLLALTTILLAPQRDLVGTRMPGLLLILGGTLAAYSATSLAGIFAGWTLSSLPHVLRWFSAPGPGPKSWAPQVALGASSVCLALGAAVMTWMPAAEGLGALRGFTLLILAALLRKGIFPFHSWVARAHEDGTPGAAALLLNGHLGALLTIRFIIPMLGEASRQALPLLNDLALFTAVYVALLALVEKKPRRILAFLSVSQASFILAGLENTSQTGITGALAYWPVVALAITGMVAVYSAIEARYQGTDAPRDLLGIGARTPRLAVFFAASGLALAGLPGTLGFVAEDLLFHGALESDPLLGVALPLATALNAITIFRLFSTLFLGKRVNQVPPMPDALARERWPLTAVTAGLVITGIAPGLVIRAVSPLAEGISRLLTD